MTELKPCPFCGGEAYLYGNYGSSQMYIRCGTCGIQTRCHYQAQTKIEWNRRAEDAELQKYRQAEASGRWIELPCKVGDKMFSLRWNIKKEKYELYTSEIKNVRYDSHDGSVMVSDGERFRVWGKTVFLTREEAEAALAKEGVE